VRVRIPPSAPKFPAMETNLAELVSDITAAALSLDSSRERFRQFQPGIGPYGEPQLVKHIAAYLNKLSQYDASARTKRTPDLLIPGKWAIEFKITRPFGDNDKEAENWSVNLLHPYPGNASSVGDCIKLSAHSGPERRVIIVIGYEHNPARIDLTRLINSFELIANRVAGITLSPRIETRSPSLVHPVHQVLRVFAWEVIVAENSI
jgi:hypothetical protein